MSVKRKVVGLAAFSAGLGMIFVLIIPCFGFFLAAFLIAFGIWELID